MCQEEEMLRREVEAAQIAQMEHVEEENPIFQEFGVPEHYGALESVKQDGSNCGCFAAGIGIASLMDWGGWERHKARAVAKEIEDIAVGKGLSSIGELFDANALTEAVNLYSDKHFGQDMNRRLFAKTVDIDSAEALDDLLCAAKERGVKVLVPYFVEDGETFEPGLPGDTQIFRDTDGVFVSVPQHDDNGRVTAEFMHWAHWTVVESVGGSHGVVQMVEGNVRAHRMRCSVDEVFASNQSLGDLLSWESPISSVTPDEMQAVRDRWNKLGEEYEEGEDDGPVPVEYFEKVNLRGKAVLLGCKKD